MGNQLAAAASVNLADVSPSLQLIAPLGGEGRNYFTTLHCYQRVEAPVKAKPVTGAAQGDRTTASSTTTSGSTAATWLVRDNLWATQRRARQHSRLRRRHWQDARAAAQSSSSTIRPPAFFDDSGLAGGDGESDEGFEFSDELRGHASNYAQILLHRSGYGTLSNTAVSSTATVLHNSEGGATGYGNALPTAATGFARGYLGYGSVGGALASSPPSPYPLHGAVGVSGSFRSGTQGGGEGIAGGVPSAGKGATTAATTTTPSSSSASVTASVLVDTVAKVFVRTPDEKGQQWFLQRLRELLRSMQEQLEAVDSTRQPPPPATTATTSQRHSNHRDLSSLLTSFPQEKKDGASGDTGASGVPATTAEPYSLTGVSPPVSILFYTDVYAGDERFCMLQRPYVAYSLPERLVTRPYWSLMDRLFACYQLLQAVAQLHDVYGVVHGDIKPSNVLVQSTGWLYVTDLAPFKPARVPVDNPVLFDYYYDTDDTHHCYLAPEKFTSRPLPPPPAESPVTASTVNYNVANINLTGHSAAMDVFSAACVMAMMLTDEPLFSLAQVLELRGRSTVEAREAFVEPLLRDRGVPASVVRMLLSMLCSLPEARPAAHEVLEEWTPSVFPRSFTVLYETVLPTLLSRPPDVQLQVLFARLEDIVEACAPPLSSPSSTPQHGGVPPGSASPMTATAAEEKDEEERPPSTAVKQHVIQVLLPVLQHAMRTAVTDDAVYRGMACLQRCLPYVSLATQTELILPQLLYAVNSPVDYPPLARVVALRMMSAVSLTAATQLCQRCPTARGADFAATSLSAPPTPAMSSSDDRAGVISKATLMDDLILPCVGELLRHAGLEETVVLVELATHLPQLLLLSRYYLEKRQHVLQDSEGGGPSGGRANQTRRRRSFGAQLQSLQRNGWDMLQVLFKHPSVAVVAAVLRHTAHVAAFLGEARTQDDLIPLLTTAITSPAAVQRVLYPNAIHLHLLLQRPQLKTLRFFVDEALRQTDTASLKGALDTVAAVVRARKFDVWDTMTLVHQALPHLISPYHWVSAAACSVVEAAAQSYRSSELTAYLECAVRPLLTHHVPLACLGSFPSVIRAELALTTPDALDAVSRRAAAAATATVSDISANAVVVVEGGEGDTAGTELYINTNGNHGEEVALSDAAIVRRPTASVGALAALALPLPATIPRRSLGGAVGPAEGLTLRDVSYDVELAGSTTAAVTTLVSAPPLSVPQTERGPSTTEEDERSGVADIMRYTPTHREAERLRLRATCRHGSPSSAAAAAKTSSSASTATDVVGDGRTSPASFTSAGPLAVRNPAPGLPCPTGVYWSSTGPPLCPIGVPRFTAAAHTGTIHGMTSPSTGVLVTAGSRGECLVWGVDANRVERVQRAPLTSSGVSSTSHTFLVAKTIREGRSPWVGLGSTDGAMRILDVARNAFTQTWSTDGSAITDYVVQKESVLLSCTAAGALVVNDLRDGDNQRHGAVWRTVLNPRDGAPSRLAPLYEENNAYGVATMTYDGVVHLYDLRFQLCVKRYELSTDSVRCGNAATPVERGQRSRWEAPLSHTASPPDSAAPFTDGVTALPANPFAILATSPDPLAMVHSRVAGPALLLATSGGTVYRLQLRTGELSLALQPCHGNSSSSSSCGGGGGGGSGGFSAAAVRAMVTQPAHGIVWTGAEDGYLRQWSALTPSQSHTLFAPPYLSPAYERVSTGGPRGWAVREVPVPAAPRPPPRSSPVAAATATTTTSPPAGGGRAGDRSRRGSAPTSVSTVPWMREGCVWWPSLAPPPPHHNDSILSLAVVQTPVTTSGERSQGPLSASSYLVSGARDGTLTVWFNESS